MRQYRAKYRYCSQWIISKAHLIYLFWFLCRINNRIWGGRLTSVLPIKKKKKTDFFFLFMSSLLADFSYLKCWQLILDVKIKFTWQICLGRFRVLYCWVKAASQEAPHHLKLSETETQIKAQVTRPGPAFLPALQATHTHTVLACLLCRKLNKDTEHASYWKHPWHSSPAYDNKKAQLWSSNHHLLFSPSGKFSPINKKLNLYNRNFKWKFMDSSRFVPSITSNNQFWVPVPQLIWLLIIHSTLSFSFSCW